MGSILDRERRRHQDKKLFSNLTGQSSFYPNQNLKQEFEVSFLRVTLRSLERDLFRIKIYFSSFIITYKDEFQFYFWSFSISFSRSFLQIIIHIQKRNRFFIKQRLNLNFNSYKIILLDHNNSLRSKRI